MAAGLLPRGRRTKSVRRRILSFISSFMPRSTGRCISITRPRRLGRSSCAGWRMANPLDLIRKLGNATVERVWRLGFAARFFWMVLVYSGASFRRLPLTLREIYFSGVLSLLIILVSGLFVGLVLGLQGYETLQRYGSTEALGILVALSLTRELGPVVAGLLFASRAGSSVTAEIGLMKATEQMQDGVDWRYDVWNGVIKSFVFGVAVSLIAVFEGYDSVPTAEGVSRAITRTVVTSVLAVLALDFVLTSFMFRGNS